MEKKRKYYKATLTLYMKANSPKEFLMELQEMLDAYYYDNKTMEQSEDAHEPIVKHGLVRKISEEEYKNAFWGERRNEYNAVTP